MIVRRRSVLSGALAAPALIRLPRGDTRPGNPDRCEARAGNYVCRKVSDRPADVADWLRRCGTPARVDGDAVVITIRGREVTATRGWWIVVDQRTRESAVIDPAGFFVVMRARNSTP